MANFNSFEQLQKAILEKAKKAMNTKVAEQVKKTESEAIQDVVLETYTPTYYERRTTSGIESTENMHHQINNNGNNIELTVINDTPTNGDESRDYTLNEAIIYGGEFYEYPSFDRDPNKYTYLKSRDYITETVNRLRSEGKVVEILKKELGGK